MIARPVIAQSIVEPEKFGATSSLPCFGGIGAIVVEFSDNKERYVKIDNFSRGTSSTSKPTLPFNHVFQLVSFPGVYGITVFSPLTDEVFERTIEIHPKDMSDEILSIVDVKGNGPGCLNNSNVLNELKGYFDFSINLTDYWIVNSVKLLLYNEAEELVFEKNIINGGEVEHFDSPLLELGDYKGVLDFNSCVIPIDSILSLVKKSAAEFEIEDTYYFNCGGKVKITPSSEGELQYSLYDSNGDFIDSGDEFNISQPGFYSIISEEGEFCPTSKIFEIISEIWERPQVEMFGDPCERSIILKTYYEIPNEVNAKIQWFSEAYEEEPIGEGERVTVTENGAYFAKLHFLDHPSCDVVSDRIEISGIPPYVDPDFVTSPAGFCNGVNSLLLIPEEENLPDEAVIRWYEDHYSENNLIQEVGRQLEIFDPGMYFAAIQINGCHLTMDSIYVRELEEKPVAINQTYDLCGYTDAELVLDPGDFSDYEWYKGDEMVSSEHSFSPENAGNYSVWLKNENGCIYSEDFEVTEECEAEINYSTGIKPLKSKFPLVVYFNSYVEKIEVKIFDKWGGVIFKVDQDYQGFNSESGIWDGTINGAPAPIGIYNLLIKYIGKDGRSGTIRDVISIVN